VTRVATRLESRVHSSADDAPSHDVTFIYYSNPFIVGIVISRDVQITVLCIICLSLSLVRLVMKTDIVVRLLT